MAYHPADPLCPRETDVEASNQDNETETEPAAEAVEEQEAPAAEAEAPAEEPAAEEAPVAEAAEEAPAAESDAEPEAAAEEAEEEEREPMDAETEAEIAAEFVGEAGEEYEAEAEAAAVAVATGPTVARVYICKHGHRTVSLWSTPETCLRRVKGHICGEGLVALADAPPDAKEKMLNPLKASKKAAKKS